MENGLFKAREIACQSLGRRRVETGKGFVKNDEARLHGGDRKQADEVALALRKGLDRPLCPFGPPEPRENPSRTGARFAP